MASRVLSRFGGGAGRLTAQTCRSGVLSGGTHSLKESVVGSTASSSIQELSRVEGFLGECFKKHMIGRIPSTEPKIYDINRHGLSCVVRTCAANYSTDASEQKSKQEKRKDISTIEDPFDAPTYNIPEKPVTFTEGASYSIVILAGLGIAGLAAYAVFKELIFEPKEYKIFGKALQRVQNDSQVTAQIGFPVTGYGQESRNRAARQRIPNRVWTDEEGVEHVEVNFYIRGPHGAGKVYSEMFKNPVDKKWTFTYLIVEIKSPSQKQLMLESYVPA